MNSILIFQSDYIPCVKSVWLEVAFDLKKKTTLLEEEIENLSYLAQKPCLTLWEVGWLRSLCERYN